MSSSTVSPFEMQLDNLQDGRLLLPENPPRLGPKSRVLLGRLAIVLGLWELIGSLLVFAGGEAAVTFGLSMVFPGGGLLYQGSLFGFLLIQAAMVMALVLWWGISTHFAIPLVWFFSCLAGLLLVGDGQAAWTWATPVSYLLAVGTLGWMVYRFEHSYRTKRSLIPELNEYLRTAEVPDAPARRRELDDIDAELLRWCYDFAFQPEDGLDGLDWGEQFHGGTQLRYQLNGLAWGLSVGAANYLPNAPKRVREALESMVRKHTDLRVWQYWQTLNLLGNFDPNPDPIVKDNIMFSGFLGDVINSVEAATGTDAFDQPGSLEFVWKDGRVFSYDHHSITDAVKRNFESSQLGFFPCEPGWSFTVCNVMGAQTLYGHDVAHGTDTWQQVGERWQKTLDEEYATPNGSYAHIRSNHVGLSWDTGEVPGGDYYANGTHRFADILPAHAMRARALEVKGAEKIKQLVPLIKDGRLDLDLPPEPERHRTRTSKVAPWIKVIGGAQLVGEADLAEAAIRSSGEKCATGERWPLRPVNCSGQQLGPYMMLRWTGPIDLSGLTMRGYEPPKGPVLDDTDWETLLVTEAWSDDGSSMTLAARPMDERAQAAVTLSLTQLKPSAEYQLTGMESVLTFAADEAGKAQLDVVIDSPVRCEIKPVEAA